MSRLLCALALLTAACGAGSEPVARTRTSAEPARATPVASSTAPAASRPNDASAAANTDATIATALELVARVRGLAARKPVPGVRLDRKALHAEVERLLAEETPADAIAGNTEVLFALDTVPANFDLQGTLLRLYASELAGFYDPKLGRMVLASDLGDDSESVTLYHELVHALQDQHFDLSHAFDWKPEATDAEAALHALAEGDATAAMTDVFAAARGVPFPEVSPALMKLGVAQVQATPALRDVPGVIARSMVAPYIDGITFVAHLRKQGGWRAIDDAFKRAPVSTEQIIHPQKYLAAEPVVALPAIETPAGFSDNAFRDVMGEEGMRAVFEEWLPAPAAAEAASDWGGDRLAVFSAGDQRLMRWHLVFDTDAAAQRALHAFARAAVRPELGGAYEPLRPFGDRKKALAAIQGDQVCQPRTQRGAFAAARHGRHVGVSLGPYERAATDAATVRGTSDCAASLAAARSLARAR